MNLPAIGDFHRPFPSLGGSGQEDLRATFVRLGELLGAQPR
jgi:hypothetical protein